MATARGLTMAEAPDRIIKFRGVLTEADLERFRQGWQRVMAAADSGSIWVPPLPRRTRLRLWLTSRVDHGAVWLADHGHSRAAITLWRACGLWGHG